MGRKMTAKVTLGSKIQYPGYSTPEGDQREPEKETWFVTFVPDYYGDSAEKNKAWAQASPSLNFQITMRGDVADTLKQGSKFTVTFECDDEPEAAVKE